MKEGLRRRLPALATLAALLGLAGASFWMLALSERSEPGAGVQTRGNEPDYIIDNFRYVSVARDGKAKYLIEGEQLTHVPAANTSFIRQPRLTSYAPARPPMKVRADDARINGDHSEIHLENNVKLERPQTGGTDKLTVESDYMLLLPDQDVAKTDRPVRARLGDSTLDGTGMVADNARQLLTLQSRVNATYVQPQQAGE